MFARLLVVLLGMMLSNSIVFAQTNCPFQCDTTYPEPLCACGAQPGCVITILHQPSHNPTRTATQHLKEVLDCYSGPFNQRCTGGITACTPCQNSADCPGCQGGCPTQIIIPAGIEIEVGGSVLPAINLNCRSNGLQLTINGTIKWMGQPCTLNCPSSMLQLNSARNVIISGTGKFYAPASVIHGQVAGALPAAIRILDACNIEINGLEFENIGYMIKQESGTVHDLRLKNLTGKKLWEYGVFFSSVNTALIENCHISVPNGPQGVYDFHGFRLYGNSINVYNCSAHNVQRRPLWRVEGTPGGIIDGFVSTYSLPGNPEPFTLGPNHACMNLANGQLAGGPDTGQRLRNTIVKNVTAPQIQIELGTMGCNLESNINAVVGIGRVPSPPNTPPTASNGNVTPRPIDRIYWYAGLSVNPPPSTVCVGSQIGNCFADITDDGMVNVNDLLAVINNWGPGCAAWVDVPQGGTCDNLNPCQTPLNACPADIVPVAWGNEIVNVNDLLAVINAWGPCPGFSGQVGSLQSVQDCMDAASQEYEAHTPEWNDYVNKCVEGLCAAGILPPSDCP